ncbi:MtnX-like HAD-IB family phosphatase [Pleomorphomonas oryzae]|uniref:MtnX-like HAD-IB family phosphatase n=1 Tax=Pleomorphomonas oryzae TaxID=261934 RepID=UPI00040F2510|nr:MtnX-like HAD-IB family phosphatase [Pleomorphomonas oryzae]
MLAYCDFDGTIATDDVTDLVLDRFALPEWRDIEARWEAGLINSAECMQAQIRLIHAGQGEIDELLEQVEIDPGFADFKRFCDRNDIEIVIVSDGVDHFIRRVLACSGISGIRIVANRLIVTKAGFDLGFPHARSDCRSAAGVCKCAALKGNGSHIYIGDGRSDFCAARSAAMVFAKDKLAAYCRREAIPHVVYGDFFDVLDVTVSMTGSSHPSFHPSCLSQQL